MIHSLELFSGAGGLAKGIELAGINHCGFIEFNHDACETLRQNYDLNLIHEIDVRKFDFSEIQSIDLIAGGPPCQPFSLGGIAKGMNDKRDMFPEAIRAIREKTPKVFLFENVKGLLRKSFAPYFEFIILQLKYPHVSLPNNDWRENLSYLKNIDKTNQYDGLKYDVQYKLINAADYGIPQKRERVIIVGIRSDLNAKWEFPKPTHSQDALLWEKYVTGDYWKRHNILPTEIEQPRILELKDKLERKYGLFPPQEKPWKTIRDVFVGLPDPELTNDFATDHVFKPGAKMYYGHTGSEIDEPSKTIKAGAHGVPGGENTVDFCNGKFRYLTVLETKRIQTFPDDYKIAGSWTESMRQLGNAVPVELAKVLAESLIPIVI